MKALLLGLLTAVLWIQLGCTKKKTKHEYGLNPAETLRINLRQEPPSLDWSKSTDTTSSLIEYNIMEGLTEYDLNDPELGLVPALATEWSSNKDATTWTFGAWRIAAIGRAILSMRFQPRLRLQTGKRMSAN